jgi:lipopolysaccharide biosynthesis protein
VHKITTKSSKVNAIVAHFDSNNEFNSMFLNLLEVLASVVDSVVVVTTSNIDVSQYALHENVKCIVRPNIGYDFYSYRVGVNALEGSDHIDSILFINSSILITDKTKFQSTLIEMITALKNYKVVGYTCSLQIEMHIQSYLFAIRGECLFEKWFIDWSSSIRPLNSKMELILEFELGFTRYLLEYGIPFQCLVAYQLGQSMQSQINGNSIGSSISIAGDKCLNPSHYIAKEIAEKHGFIKAELLRTNPNNIDTSWLSQCMSIDLYKIIEKQILIDKANYIKKEDGLTVFVDKTSPFRTVYTAKMPTLRVKTAVVLHLFYADIIASLAEQLKKIIIPYDLYITCPSEALIPQIIDAFSQITPAICILCCENRGRDIKPFIDLYRSNALDSYNFVLKLHGKKSNYVENGEKWRDSLYTSLFGNYDLIHKTEKIFEDSKIGMVGPHRQYLTHMHYWGGNLDTSVRLIQKMGVTVDRNHIDLGFFAGSMFWFRPTSFIPIKKLTDEELKFEDEAGQRDGTLAHAFERIFGNVSRCAGFMVTSIEANGLDIQQISTIDNRAPIPESPENEGKVESA